MRGRLFCFLSFALPPALLGGMAALAAAGLAAAAGAAEPVTLDTDPHLVGWWKLDDASGTKAVDSSGRGHDGVLAGGASWEKNGVPGRAGRALELDGREASVEIPGYKGVTGTRPRTLAAWIRTKAPRGRILSWGHRDFGQMWIFGFIRGRVGVTPHGGYYYMNPEVHDGKWHHVAVVVREAELPNLHDDVALYLDGEVAEVHDIGLLDLWPVDTGRDLDVRIGDGFRGAIDDVRIYDRALTEDEVHALFALRSDRPLPASR